MKFAATLLLIGSTAALSGANYQSTPSGNQGGNQNYYYVPVDTITTTPTNPPSTPSTITPGQPAATPTPPGQPYKPGQLPSDKLKQNTPASNPDNKSSGSYYGPPSQPFTPTPLPSEQMKQPYQYQRVNAPGTGMSDATIQKNISDIMRTNWVTQGYKVSFEVNEGKVTLHGSVGSAEDKAKIEEDVRKIPGVTSIDNEIKAPDSEKPTVRTATSRNIAMNLNQKAPSSSYQNSQDTGTTETDRIINQKIRGKLNFSMSSPQAYSNITFRTSNGIVTVTGTVNNASDIRAIGDQIRSIEGVKGINNLLIAPNQ